MKKVFVAVAVTTQANNEILGVYGTERAAAAACCDFWPQADVCWRGATLLGPSGKALAFYCARTVEVEVS
jgi:hypothetical protein